MSEYYNSQRIKGLYDSASAEPFKLSRSKIDLFTHPELRNALLMHKFGQSKHALD